MTLPPTPSNRRRTLSRAEGQDPLKPTVALSTKLQNSDLKSGSGVKITGPVGKEMLMPKDPNATIIMGFMARAKGIPALELYRLAQKKKRKLVLCGHSLGGAVAALATLAILRVIAASSPSKENDKVSVKCITFSQPPVGNAALKDYVIRKGWQHYFKSYCIPEDLVPRILSPAYFHHYNAQPQPMPSENDTNILVTKHEQGAGKPKENDGH
ncbi:hypothetical protein RIF29_17271 [Crotalaria pallida]|uniref:Fungal lipase-type domain-containing protein n=1 Tax=Crotalaria pallida TaxID=3830 RepID=A0AAN9FQ92_CROPI